MPVESSTDRKGPSWPLPRPLPEHVLRGVMPYTPEMVPDALRPWLVDVAERGQFSFDYLAVAAVAALGAAIGSKCAIYPKQRDDWHEVPNLWGGIVGRPGMMKSPAMSKALAPLKRVASAWQADHEAALTAFKTAQKKEAFIAKEKAKAAVKRAQKAISDGRTDFELPEDEEDKPPPPSRRIVTSDATKEKLASLLIDNPAGMMLELDELAALFHSMEDDQGLREFLLKAWNGKDSHNVDRINRGEMFVPRVCMSVFGGIQPGRIAPYVRRAVGGGSGNDGFLSRFQLIAFPDGHQREWNLVDRWPNHDAFELAQAAYSQLANADPESFPNANQYGLPGLRFDDIAQDHFFGWFEDIQRRLRAGEEPDALAEVLNKWLKLVPALSLIFELADDPAAQVVGAQALAKAFRWADVAESHQRRLYDTANTDLDAAQRIMERVRKGDLARDGFSARDIMRKNWSGLNDKDAIRDALALLEDYGWIIPENPTPGAKGGRPTVIYLPNPLTDRMPLGGEPGGFVGFGSALRGDVSKNEV